MNELSLDAIFGGVSVVVAVVTFVISNHINKKKDRQLARKEIYLSLEYAAIDLFRFEASNIELIRPVWEADQPVPAKNKAEYEVLTNYICQMLNLFELAITFRRNDTMPHDVFGSWVDWFFKLSQAPGFKKLWPDIRINYVDELRRIFDFVGIEGNAGDKKTFFLFVSKIMDDCPVIRDWPVEQEASPILDEGKRTSEPEIEWWAGQEPVERLVRFFKENVSTSYISHSEIMEGRAIDEDHWAADLEQKLHREFLAAIDKQQIAVAFCDGELAGMMYTEWGQSYGVLSDIVVKKDQQGSGIGNAMIRWLMQESAARHARFIMAESGLKNTGAHRFLEKNGFEKVSSVFKLDLPGNNL